MARSCNLQLYLVEFHLQQATRHLLFYIYEDSCCVNNDFIQLKLLVTIYKYMYTTITIINCHLYSAKFHWAFHIQKP